MGSVFEQLTELAVVDNSRFAVDTFRHSSIDISISGLAATLLFPIVRQCRIFVDTFFELAMVENIWCFSLELE